MACAYSHTYYESLAQQYPENAITYNGMASQTQQQEIEKIWADAGNRLVQDSVTGQQDVLNRLNQSTDVEKGVQSPSDSNVKTSGVEMLCISLIIFLIPVIGWIIVTLIIIRSHSEMCGIYIIMMVISAAIWAFAIWLIFF
jgi:hypothetical protein